MSHTIHFLENRYLFLQYIVIFTPGNIPISCFYLRKSLLLYNYTFFTYELKRLRTPLSVIPFTLDVLISKISKLTRDGGILSPKYSQRKDELLHSIKDR